MMGMARRLIRLSALKVISENAMAAKSVPSIANF